MASHETATPGSSNMDGAPSNHKTPKDRQCQWCHEMFTSSSLGRHLDQFIKGDKAKAPDGKHNVEEIRKMRGAVTRRTARTSSAKRDINTANDSMTPDGAISPPPSKRTKINGISRGAWNQASLESTGVIPEIHGAPYFSRGDVVEKQRQAAAERDEGRAAKLALIEVLDNLKAGKAHTAHSSPFSFDFLAQSFPALVLLMMPRQPTILSSQLIPSAKCWPIEPPSRTHFDLLRKVLSQRLDEYAVERRTNRNQRDSEDSARSQSSNDTSNSSLDFSSYHEHLQAAYNAWAAISETEKHKQYHLEFARAFAREQGAHAETKRKLESAEQKNAHQAIQIKRLNELQQPQEFLRSPMSAAPYPSEMAKFVASKLGSDQLPTAEALISKWRPSVKNNPGWQKGFVPQLYDAAEGEDDTQDATDGTPQVASTGPNGFGTQIANGTENNSASLATMEHDAGDSEDASGEDDDEVEVMPPATNAKYVGIHGLQPMTSMIDPNLAASDTGDFGAAGLMAELEHRKKQRR